MQTFWTLLKESVITQSVLVLLIWITILALALMGKEIPSLLVDAGWATLGLFAGSKFRAAPTLYDGEKNRRLTDAPVVRGE